MSQFYNSLADHYDQIFPLNQATSSFLLSYLNQPDSHLLDIGCATGQLALHLVTADQVDIGSVGAVTAIEPDEKMVSILRQRIAQKDLNNKLSVHIAGMLDLDSHFQSNFFHIIYCFGNTLVHLQSLSQISRFLESSFLCLKPGGLLIFQIVNYTRIFAQNITQLPLIDSPEVSFLRQYQYQDNHSLLQFNTRLTFKESGRTLEHKTLLFPLQKHQVESICQDIGYETIACFGNFNRDPWQPQSPALIMVLKKPSKPHS
jgi:glycine/sarcosine N-methyltransferase